MLTLPLTAFVRPRTPCFEAVYAVAAIWAGGPTSPYIDATLIIVPLPSLTLSISCVNICCSILLWHFHTPLKLTSTTFCQSLERASWVAFPAPLTPALFTAMSMRPNAATASATPRSISSSLVTSMMSCLISTEGNCACNSRAVALRSGAEWSEIARRWIPYRAKAKAVALPIPRGMEDELWTWLGGVLFSWEDFRLP